MYYSTIYYSAGCTNVNTFSQVQQYEQLSQCFELMYSWISSDSSDWSEGVD